MCDYQGDSIPYKKAFMSKCIVEYCNVAESLTKNMCNMHYRRWSRGERGKVLSRPKYAHKGLGPKRSPSTTDLHWAAGFIEGEGSFKQGIRERNITVQAKQKDPETLYRLREMFGGSVFLIDSVGIYNWCISGPYGTGVALTLFSLLSTRRQQQLEHFLGNDN